MRSGLILLILALGGLAACSDGPPDPDAEQIEELVDDGVDASRPQSLRFDFVLATEDGARKLCRRLKTEGYLPFLARDAQGEGHVCQGTRRMLLEPRQLRQLRMRFDILAKTFGGEYRGWTIATQGDET